MNSRKTSAFPVLFSVAGERVTRKRKIVYVPCHARPVAWFRWGKKKKKGRLSEWEAAAVVNIHHGLEVQCSQLIACFQFPIPAAFLK